jgi:hypothetical protein
MYDMCEFFAIGFKKNHFVRAQIFLRKEMKKRLLERAAFYAEALEIKACGCCQSLQMQIQRFKCVRRNGGADQGAYHILAP